MRILSLFFIHSLTLVSGFVRRPLSQSSPRILQRTFVKVNQTPIPLQDVSTFISQVTSDSSKTLLQTYETALQVHPIATKSITSGILACLGDAIAQYRSRGDEGKAFEYNLQRGLCFLGFGAAYTGAFQHFWFQFLNNHITAWGEIFKLWGPTRAALSVQDIYSANQWWMYFDIVSGLENPPSDAALAAAKLSLNQFLMVPGFYMPMFFALTGTLEKLNVAQSIERAKTMYAPLLSRNYFFWLPVQFIQFLVVPTEWQIPFLSAASLVWTVILSSIASQPSSQSTQLQRVTYESTSDDEIQVALLVSSDATEDVSLQDVEEALIPQAALDAISNPKVGATTAGGLMALLTAAADDGLIGGEVASLLGTNVEVSVAALTAIGAGIALAAASKTQEDDGVEFDSLGRPEDEMRDLYVEKKPEERSSAKVSSFSDTWKKASLQE